MVEDKVVAVCTSARTERHRHAQRTAQRHTHSNGSRRIAEDVVHLIQNPILQFCRSLLVVAKVVILVLIPKRLFVIPVVFFRFLAQHAAPFACSLRTIGHCCIRGDYLISEVDVQRLGNHNGREIQGEVRRHVETESSISKGHIARIVICARNMLFRLLFHFFPSLLPVDVERVKVGELRILEVARLHLQPKEFVKRQYILHVVGHIHIVICE